MEQKHHLGDANGWNNGVKLLNDACQALYGNSSKSITATNLSFDKVKEFLKDSTITKYNGLYAGTKGQKQGMVSTLGDTTNNNICPDMLWNCYGSVRKGKATGGTLQPWEQDSFLDAGNDYGRSEENFRAVIHGFEINHVTEYQKNKTEIGKTSDEYKTSDSGINYFKILFNNGNINAGWAFYLSERTISNAWDVNIDFGIMGYGGTSDNHYHGFTSIYKSQSIKSASSYINNGGSWNGTLYPVVTVPISQLTGSSSLSVK